MKYSIGWVLAFLLLALGIYYGAETLVTALYTSAFGPAGADFVRDCLQKGIGC